MPEEIKENFYRIEVPLPGNPLRSINSYLIKGQKGNLIIDLGMNRVECSTFLFRVLEELEVDLSSTDFFITHLHADHMGLLNQVAHQSSSIYFNAIEAEIISGEFWSYFLDLARWNGFPVQELELAIKKHPGYRYGLESIPEFTLLSEGELLEIGGYSFQCLETPGHSPGHLCLYEPEQKILVAGDLILEDITPNIVAWGEGDNPLSDYLKSLDKIYDLEVELVLPGHRRVFSSCRGRIEELRDHHQQRAQEILSILGNDKMDAYQVAARMNWDLSYDSWEQFPIPQRWFAMGEAHAHLLFLMHEERVIKEIVNDQVLYSRI